MTNTSASVLEIATVGTLFVFLICGCGVQNTRGENENNEGPPIQLETTIARLEPYTPHVKSFGAISFSSKIDIAPQIGGTVKHLYIREGERVKKGDLLAALENVQLKIQLQQTAQEVEEAEAALALTEAALYAGKLHIESKMIQIEKLKNEIDVKQLQLISLNEKVEHYQSLFRLDGVSKEELESIKLQYRSAEIDLHNTKLDLQIMKIGTRDQDILEFGKQVPASPAERGQIITEINTLTLQAEVSAAEARLATARKDLEAARLLLEELQVRAPADGVIGAKYVHSGERTSGEETIFTLFLDDTVYAVFPLREEDSSTCGIGQKVTVIIPSLNEMKIEGTIDLLSPQVDPQSGNMTAKVFILNPAKKIKPGMFIRSVIATGDTRETLFVPASAILGADTESPAVFIVIDNTVFLKKVKTGIQEGGKIEIIRGIQPGTHIVSAPPPLLQEGDLVAVTK